MKELADAAGARHRSMPRTARRAYGLLEQGVGPSVVVATFLAMSAWTWRKWPDILVDFGRELYVPWQRVAGKVFSRVYREDKCPLQ